MIIFIELFLLKEIFEILNDADLDDDRFMFVNCMNSNSIARGLEKKDKTKKKDYSFMFLAFLLCNFGRSTEINKNTN